MKISDYVYYGQVTKGQYEELVNLERNLAKITTSQSGYIYYDETAEAYLEILKEHSKTFKEVFPNLPKLYQFQSHHYHIQMFIENRFHETITGRNLLYSDEQFREILLRELAIMTYDQNGIILLWPQIKAAAVWLLFRFFKIVDFDTVDFLQALYIAEMCLEEDISVITDAWQEIRQWESENITLIDEAQEVNKEYRQLMRYAKRYANNHLMVKELEIKHFLARDFNHNGYEAAIHQTALYYHISLRSAKKRAKEIGFTKERYDELESTIYDCFEKVKEEKSYYCEVVNRKGHPKLGEGRERFYDRLRRFRTFPSAINRDRFSELPASEEELRCLAEFHNKHKSGFDDVTTNELFDLSPTHRMGVKINLYNVDANPSQPLYLRKPDKRRCLTYMDHRNDRRYSSQLPHSTQLSSPSFSTPINVESSLTLSQNQLTPEELNKLLEEII